MPDAKLPNELGAALADLMTELVAGPPGGVSYMLNGGDEGLLRSLAKISWDAAVDRPPGGGPPVAQHVDHLRYGLSLMNRWAGGEANPFASAVWRSSWTLEIASEDEWTDLRAGLEREALAWIEALRALDHEPDARRLPIDGVALRGVIGSVAHLAYHLGALRQADRATRGPSAEESAASG